MKHMVCPWWLGYLLASPLRRLFCDPKTLLSPYITKGMTVMDVGCGMGFFSLPMAQMVGKDGRVVCIDLQEKMIAGLLEKARKSALTDIIDARVCTKDHLNLDDIAGKVDFALAFAMIHEVPDKERLLSEIFRALRNGGQLLIAEPSGHVRKNEFEEMVRLTQKVGFKDIGRPSISRSHALLLRV